MINIAVLLTCFNRKAKTLAALDHIFMAYHQVRDTVSLSVYLTDDGSTDGTGEAVKKNYPYIHLLQGNGSLYWAGGMRNSWQEALKGDFDAYLLLNDDTNVYATVFEELLLSHQKCLQTYKQPGIYVGTTVDPRTQKLTYGGAVLQDKFRFKYAFVTPNNDIQSCDLGNANIMMVSKAVVDKIGILSEGYVHGVADYDYTLKAGKKNIPVLVTPNFCGTCTHDHDNIYDGFEKKSFSQRLKLLKSPLGLDFKSNLNLMLRHFPLRVPFVIVSAALKLVFPKVYLKNLANR